MDKQEILDQIKKLDDDHARNVAELKAKLEEPEKWVPKMEEKYWTPDGDVPYEFTWVNDDLDQKAAELGLVFRTKEECERAIAIIKTLNYAPYPKSGTMCDWMDSSGGWQAAGWRFTGCDASSRAMWETGRLRCTRKQP